MNPSQTDPPLLFLETAGCLMPGLEWRGALGDPVASSPGTLGPEPHPGLWPCGGLLGTQFVENATILSRQSFSMHPVVENSHADEGSTVHKTFCDDGRRSIYALSRMVATGPMFY